MKRLSKGYIISVVSAVLLLLEVVGVKVNVPYVNEVLMAVLGVLMALGIVSGTRDTISNNRDKIDPHAENEKVDKICDADKNNDLDSNGLGDELDSITSEVEKIVDTIDDAIDDITDKL